MALIICSECGREISDKAAACPHCGNPLVAPVTATPPSPALPDAWRPGPSAARPPLSARDANRNRQVIAACILVAALLLVTGVMSLRSGPAGEDVPTVSAPATPPPPPVDPAIAREEKRVRDVAAMGDDSRPISVRLAAANDVAANFSGTPDGERAARLVPELEAAFAAEQTGRQWRYSSSDDGMSGGDTRTAWVQSSNTFNFDFPYSGTQRATLQLRRHPRWGNDVMFSIEKGQLLCRSYSGCPVRVRFDDGPARTLKGTEPADSSSDTIFIPGYNDFVRRLAKAKTVRIEVNVYQEGAPVVEFDVSGFRPEKLR